jgi:hypothetical protein
MQRTPLTSSHLASVGHDPDTNTLEVEFKSGKVYQYTGVPRSDFQKLISMPSSGNAFHRVIRRKAAPMESQVKRPFRFKLVI